MPARTVVLERLVKYNGEAPRRADPGRVHPAHRPGRAARHRRRGPRGRGLAARRRPRAGRRAGLHPHLPAAQLVPARLQHGRQPGRPAGHRGRPATCWSSRSASSRPTARWSGWPGGSSATPRRSPATPRRWSATSATSPSTRALRRRISEREKSLSPPGHRRAPGGRGRVAARAAPGRRDRRAGRAPRRARRRARPRAGRRRRDPRPLVLTEDRWAGRLSTADFPAPGRAAGPDAAAQTGRPPRPRGCAATSPPRCATPASGAPGRAAAPHPRRHRRRRRSWPRCAGRCARTPATAATTGRRTPAGPSATRRLERETEQLRQKVRATTHSLARAFDRIRALLAERGYLADADGETSSPTTAERLARLWGESDLLAAECLRHGVWDGLEPAELAAVVSALVYESRRDDGPVPRVPPGAVTDALAATVAHLGGAGGRRAAAPLERTREPDLGFAWPVHRWARGESLARGADRGRAERQRALGGRLRALVPPGARPARPDRRGHGTLDAVRSGRRGRGGTGAAGVVAAGVV